MTQHSRIAKPALFLLTSVLLVQGMSLAAPERVVIWVGGDNGRIKDISQDPILQTVEKATNTDIQIVRIGDDVYMDRLNAAIASGKVPDIISTVDPYNKTFISNLVRDRIVAPFEGKVGAAAPNVLALYRNAPYLNEVKVDGKIYYQPVSWNAKVDVAGRVIHIRKDVLDKLKLKVPNTFEEYFDFMTACSKSTGMSGVIFNGKEANTVIDALNAFAGAQGLSTVGWVKTKTGFESPFVQPGMKDAILLFRQMANRKLIDPAAWEADEDSSRARYVSGGSCSFIFNGGGHVGRIQNDMNLIKKGYQEYVLPAPTAGKATRGYPSGPTFWGATFVTQLKGNNPVAAARVLNYLSSTEGLKLTALGIKGRDYTEVNGEIKLQPVQRAKDGFPSEAGNTGAHPLASRIVSWVPQEWQDFSLLYGKPQAFKKWYDQMWVNQRKYLLPSYGALSTTPLWTKFKATSDELVQRSVVEMLRAGSDAEASAKFDQFVREWRAAGGDAATAEMSKLLSTTYR